MAINILCGTDADGAFIAVDLVSGISAYAYPSSSHAASATKRPSETAAKMIASEKKARANLPPMPTATDRDREREAVLRSRNGLPARIRA